MPDPCAPVLGPPQQAKNLPLPPPALHFRRQGRSFGLALALAGWLALLGIGGVAAQVSPWILSGLALPCLPGLWDLWRNPSSGLTVGAGKIRWHVAQKAAGVALSEVALLRLDRRWDLSYRATLVLHSGAKLRLPQPALPPVQALKTSLAAHGIACQRHLFSSL
jgi:hypothetical protein